jgi:hypothetical protein
MSMIRNEQVGDVWLRDFDLGIAKTLGCVEIGQRFYLPLDKAPGVEPPLFTEFYGDEDQVGQPMPGIPLIYANPASAVQRYTLPCIRLRREDPSPALERWMSLHYKYRRPAPGFPEIEVQYGSRTAKGYARYEEQEGGYPYDIPYTLTSEGVGKGARTKAHTLLHHCMKKFAPHSIVKVVDSLGRERKYNVFVEGPSDLSIAADIRDRTIILALSLRVQAELDLRDPALKPSVSQKPTVTWKDMSEKPSEP